MSDTKVKIINAALEAFTRYGLRRVSMGEVADAAGISRQTLYAHYKNKDELVAASMREVVDRIMQDIRAAWQSTQDITAKLDIYFDHAIFKPFETLQHQPDLKDLLAGVGETTTAVVTCTNSDKAQMLAEELAPYAGRLATFGSSPLAIATFIVRSSSEMKYTARTEDELRGLMHTLRAGVLAMIGVLQTET